MEIDALKTQLGNLLALHRDDDANEDDVVFATVDYMKKAHDVAQMLLLEGRFQELQRCLHLCQAAFGDTTNVRASIVGRSGSYAPFLSFVRASTETADAGETRASKTSAGVPSEVTSMDGERATGEDHDDAAPCQPYPLFVPHSEEDRRVFAALQSRTAQLQKQLAAAMRVRRGRDTDYYMQRLGLHEKSATPVEVKEEKVKVHVHQLPHFQPNPHSESFTGAVAMGSTHASLSPAVPYRQHLASWQFLVAPQQPSHSSGNLHLPPAGTKKNTPLTGALVPTATAAAAASISPQPQPWMNGGETEVAAPTPPERGLSFGNMVHFSRGKGRVDLPPLVTSGRLFGVAYDNPTSVQHTVFGSSAAVAARVAAAAASQKPSTQNFVATGMTAPNAKNEEESDFGIHAVETVFGVQGNAEETPLHLRPVPEDVRLWSSSSSSSSSSSGPSSLPSLGSSSASSALNNASTSLKVKPAPSSITRSPMPALTGGDPLMSDVRPIAEKNNDAVCSNDAEVFTSPRTTRIPSMLRVTMKTSTLSSTTTHSAFSPVRRGTRTSSTSSPVFLSNAQEGTALLPRTIQPSWLPPAQVPKRSTDSYGMNATPNSMLTPSYRTLVSMAECSSATGTTNNNASTATTEASASERPARMLSALNASSAAIEAAKAVEAARQTTQYVLSSVMAQHLRTEQALQRCDALTISRLPYNARQAAVAARTPPRKEGEAEDEQAVLRPGRRASCATSVLPSSVVTTQEASALIPRVCSGDWTPVSQLQTATSLSSTRPSSGTCATLVSPFLTAVANVEGGVGAGRGNTTSNNTAIAITEQNQLQYLQAPPPHTVSPAAEQQLSEVRAAYEQKCARAENNIRTMEARWVIQHRLLQPRLSMPPLENIAEWRKRRGKWQQKHQKYYSEHRSGKDGGRRHGAQLRRRSRGPQPIPLPMGKQPAGTSPTSPSRASVRGSDASPITPRTFSLPWSPSPSLISATFTRESRRSSYNAEDGGGGPFSRSNSDAPQRLSVEASPLETNPSAALLSLLGTSVDRQSLPPVGVNSGSASTTMTSVGLRFPPGEGGAGDETQLTVWTHEGSEQQLYARSGGVQRYFSSSIHTTTEKIEKMKGGGFDGSNSTERGAISHLASTPSFRSELGSAFAKTGVHAHGDGELVRFTDDSMNVQQMDASKTFTNATASAVGGVAYTYHPAVDAIVKARRRRKEKEGNSLSVLPRPSITDNTLVTWQRTLRVVTGGTKASNAAAMMTDESTRPLRVARRNSSQDTLVYSDKTLSLASYSWRTGPQKRASPEAYSTSSLPPLPSSTVLEHPTLRRHGIRSVAAVVRARRTEAILSSAIRDASMHVREDDLVQPAWKQTTGQTPSLLKDLPASLPQLLNPSPLLFDLANVFVTDVGVAPNPSAAGKNSVQAPSAARDTGKNGRGIFATAPGRMPNLSLISVPSPPTTTSTQAILSLTAKALTPHSSTPMTMTGSRDDTPPTASLIPGDFRMISGTNHNNNNGGDPRSGAAWTSPVGASLPSLSSPTPPSTLLHPDAIATAHTVYQCLHAAYRASEVLRAAPDWTAVDPFVLGRCLPLCTAAARLQRWWRQCLACRELRVRQRKVHAYLTQEQRRYAAALRIQRQLRAHWAVRVVAQLQAACAAAVEQRVAAENPAAAAAGMYRAGSQFNAPLISVNHSTSQHRGVAVMIGDGTQRPILSTKNPMTAMPRRLQSHNDNPPLHRPHPESVPSNSVHNTQAKPKGKIAMAMTKLTTPAAAEGASARLLSFSSTDISDTDGGGSNKTVSPATETPGKKQQAANGKMAHAETSSSVTPQEPPHPVWAALRIQRWYRRCSEEETTQMRREVGVLAAVVTRRAPLTAVRDALRGPAVRRAKDESHAEGDDVKNNTINSSSSNADDTQEYINDVDTRSGIAEMRTLLAKCSGDVYEAYLQRASAARQQGDYKTPLELVSLRELQQIRQKRVEEAKEKRLLQERQQRLRQEQQQRRERQMMDAAKLLQRVGRGLRWRRWLRERQCRALHYRATHTLGLLSQTGTLGIHAFVDDSRRTVATELSQGGLSATAAEQRVYLTGGPRVTAHVMRRLRTTHPEWFGLNVDKESAAWISCNATAEQLSAIATVQSFVAVFESRSVIFERYQHACARTIQLVWRLYQRRRQQRTRSSRRKGRAQSILKS